MGANQVENSMKPDTVIRTTRLPLVATLLLMLPAPVFACMCAKDPPFSKVWPRTDLVVRAKVDSYGPELPGGEFAFPDGVPYLSMKIAIIERLAGQEELSSISVYGDNGILCRPYITPEQFRRGQEYVFALHAMPPENPEVDSPTQYFLSICGENWLPVRGANVVGRISSQRRQSMPYRQLRSLLERGTLAQ